jgi:hypothetical protein
MSIKQQLELECPNCHERQETAVWSSINVQLSPEAKHELLAGRLNVLQCHNCGNQATIATDLLYHDMEEQFWVQYLPFEKVMSGDLQEHFGPEGEIRSQSPGPEAAYISRPPHLVFDMNELGTFIS